MTKKLDQAFNEHFELPKLVEWVLKKNLFSYESEEFMVVDNDTPPLPNGRYLFEKWSFYGNFERNIPSYSEQIFKDGCEYMVKVVAESKKYKSGKCRVFVSLHLAKPVY